GLLRQLSGRVAPLLGGQHHAAARHRDVVRRRPGGARHNLRARRARGRTAMDPWELAAREEIRELVACYAHHADAGRLDELVALFTEDGLLQIDDREPLRGRDAILAFLADTRSGARESPAARFIRHHVSSLRIDVSGRDNAAGSSYFLVVTER